MCPQSLSSLAGRLDSDCSPGVGLPASRPCSEQCRTSLPCLVLKHEKRSCFLPISVHFALNAFSHASPITVCLLFVVRVCPIHERWCLATGNFASCVMSSSISASSISTDFLRRRKQVCGQKCYLITHSYGPCLLF